jgi:hypothetical protein
MQCKFLEIKRRNSLPTCKKQMESLPLVHSGSRAGIPSHPIPHIRPLPAPRSAIFGKKERKEKKRKENRDKVDP